MHQTTSTGSSRRMMTAMFLPLFASLLSISIVNVALPAIEESLEASSADLQWVLSGYALAFGMALVPAGRAGDIWGRRRLFLIGVVVFGLASLGAALAMSPLVLNTARVFMGFAAGILTPQVIGMIQQLFSGPARGRAYGMMGTVIGVAVAAGPALGGLIIDTTAADVGWRMTFLINVPVTVAALIGILLWLPKPQDDDAAAEPATTDAGPDAASTGSTGTEPHGLQRLDPLGVVLLSLAVLLLMLPFIQFRSLLGGLFAVAGLLMLGIWALWERRLGRRHESAPMVNLKLFALPSYTLNSMVLGLYFAGMPAIWAVVAVYVQQGQGRGALIAGLVTLPSAVMVMLLSSRVGKAVESKGPRILVAGTITAVAAMLLLSGTAALMATPYGSIWLMAAALGVVGISQALIIPSAQTLSMHDVPEEMAGAAGGVAQTVQRVFTAIGIAVVTGIYFSVTAEQGHQSGIVIATLVIAGLMLSSVAAAIFAAKRAALSAAG
ncbi:MFS transporter [Nesterenkonia halotolerans]|uniref:MFS family permease n=1 Tax=Nesterenkonia halotolerans TaxID=225325 RepID=A0ABR9J9V0_9MICC|nr:MFS transporter [Nesterenkonia halotolerans]MBE1515652.1 MFS family permease [Nesterenkonia halotolerans]